MALCTHCGLSHDMTGPLCPVTENDLDVAGLCGTTIDRYRVERWLGGGGFGAVYAANHTVMDRPVALKVLHAQMRTLPKAVKRFFGEAKAATAIGSPRIVQVFDAGTAPEGHAFLAMELVDGCSLKSLAEAGPLAPARAIHITLGILEALAAAHQAGIIHRDVKPGNVMLGGTSPDGSRTEDDVRLVDFGVSKARQLSGHEDMTRTGMTMGSPGYAAPEQYLSAKDADERSDIYGVCVLLYQLLSGTMPFEATSYEQMVVQVCTKDAPPLHDAMRTVPEELSLLVDRGLARVPSARWQGADELSAALTPWVRRLAQASAPPPGFIDGGSAPPTRAYDSYDTDPLPDPSVTSGPNQQLSKSTDVAVMGASAEQMTAETSVTAVNPRRKALWMGIAALLVASGVAAALIITSASNSASSPEPIGNNAAPVASPPVEPAVAVPVSTTPAVSDSQGALVTPVTPIGTEPGGSVTAPMAPRQRRGRARGSARRANERGQQDETAPANTPEPTTQMTTGRGFGLEDIEPFDPN